MCFNVLFKLLGGGVYCIASAALHGNDLLVCSMHCSRCSGIRKSLTVSKVVLSIMMCGLQASYENMLQGVARCS